MAFFNQRDRVIECKIVYYGPGVGGKTTNLQQIFRAGKSYAQTDMVSIDTKGDRTLYFDFLPMGIGKIMGCDVKVQLFTVPGQPKYRSTRKMVLKGVDGIVFVADSLKVRKNDNLVSLNDLKENLAEQDINMFNFPLVIQYNKRDLSENGIPIMQVAEMQNYLNGKLKAPYYTASAINGKGVSDTLKKSLKLTLRHLQHEYKWAQ